MNQKLPRSHLGSMVLLPEDDGYAEAARTFSTTGTPALIVRPRDAHEVSAAIRYARHQDLAVSVRSGGHSVLGHSAGVGGMTLDLRRLDAVTMIDDGERIVRIGAGADWGRVAAFLEPYGLALTAGDHARVGVGGLTVGGGIGWLVRKHGLAIDNLLAARVVTADGRLLVASEDENEDLFWAIRGGGGNFGVVVSFDFAAQPVTTVHYGTVTYQGDDVVSLLRGWRDHMRSAQDELSSTLVLTPKLFGMPESVMLLLCYSGNDSAAAAEAIDPLLGLGTVTGKQISATRYVDILEKEAELPPGVRIAARNSLVRSLGDEVLAAIAGTHGSNTSTVLSLRSLGGAFARVPADATAFAHRDAEAMIVATAFLEEGATEAEVEKALTPWQAVAAHGSGVYGNFQGSETAADLAAIYPPATYARLAAAKQTYDPANVFHRNHNIAPSGAVRTEGIA
ncbi:FAD/FMN-containing dehydrogenase [Amycolatopsis marina]|uniref:FAD/FMN-containing dehydrogenase n=1 Tax=Amycolatopsis marina TaxID=490629 RepID=A0A1I0X0B5_9PSEU|nr:FAD-binding oxidoreductase [Amycolatopsis marina]SFA94087.1 FAD/FMN-containing dehydrogenase [Amycolatopsis marina]